ncbi:hypothetical protein RSAG8_11583, partial [Rhizoctonia solani AG-8 WAC10335]
MPQGGFVASSEGSLTLDPAQVEEIYLSIPSPQSAQPVTVQWTSESHLAGSQNDYKSALDLLHTFHEHLGISCPKPLPIYDAGTPESRNAILGISKLEQPKVWIDTYYPLLESPGERRLELLNAEGAVSWSANLEEGDAIGAWHAWSKSADVTGKVVYANYGYDSDFEALKKAGYDVAGSIALIRESRTFRGLKIKGAAAAGAIGCLLFTDPREDSATVEHGYKPWPEGPARNPRSITRGHVMDISMKSGDPTTPGYPSYQDAPRVEPDSFPSIPSLPISWSNAEVLFKAMEASGGKVTEHEGLDSATVEHGYKPWPEGPARNPRSVKRGHVMDITMKSGDPTTPGYPSYRDAPRVEPDSFPSIPSLPISWSNAEVLFKAMGASGGKVTEHEVRLVNQTHRKIGPIWNVMVAIPGHIRDEVVIAGNHRDAWVFGASDPTSGTVSLHEMSRGLGELLRHGWKPLRTILLASWDGEEFGLFGSTEWGEDFRDWLKEHAVAYINVDKSSSGRELRVRGTPSIAPLLRQVALELPHYEKLDSNRTLWDARGDRGPFMGAPKHRLPNPSVHGTGIRTLGSGSDYTVFLQQLGITCGDLAFTNTDGDAVYHYHSFYDSEDWMDMYGDPGCLRRVAIAKYWGLVLLRIADSFILPLDTTQYALELDDYLNKVDLLLPTLPGAPDITQLRDAIKKVQEASKNLDLHKAQVHGRLHDYINRTRDSNKQDARALVQQALGSFSSERSGTAELKELLGEIRSINKKLFNFERGFISEAGLPGREWYRHMIVAPGKWIGYGATTFPSLTEAITFSRDPALAAQQVERLSQLLHTLADFLNKKMEYTEQPDQSQSLSAL